MRAFHVSLIVVLFSVLSGCEREASIPGGKFVIETTVLAQSGDLYIALLDVTFSGRNTVRVYEEQDAETLWVEPDRETGIGKCDILILADLVNQSSCRRVKWLHQIRSSGSKAGGPAIYSLEQDQSLDDLLKMEILSGEYSIGSEITIATFQGRQLKLGVDPVVP